MKRVDQRIKQLIICMALLLSFIWISAGNKQLAQAATLQNPRVANGVSTWDVVTFGNYYQSDSVKKEPIEWRVLSVDGDDVFLLADKLLDSKAYHGPGGLASWSESTIRNWLNNDFYNAAFSDEEKTVIKTSEVIDEKNPFYGTLPGNDTFDKVFFLSANDVLREDYGFITTKDESATRVAEATPYAISQGCKAKTDKSHAYYLKGDWYTRTSGRGQEYVAGVVYTGYVGGIGGIDYKVGFALYVTGNGVRPAIHVDSSAVDLSYIGTISSNGTATGSVKILSKVSTSSRPTNSTSKSSGTTVAASKKATIKVSKTKVKRGKKTTVKITSNSGAKLKIAVKNSRSKKAKRKKYIKIKNGKTAKIIFGKKAVKGKYTFTVTSPKKGKFRKTTKTIKITVK